MVSLDIPSKEVTDNHMGLATLWLQLKTWPPCMTNVSLEPAALEPWLTVQIELQQPVPAEVKWALFASRDTVCYKHV